MTSAESKLDKKLSEATTKIETSTKPASPEEADNEKEDSKDVLVKPTFWQTKGLRWILSLIFITLEAVNFIIFLKNS